MKPSVLPALGLFFLAPLVAEFLLGNLPIAVLPALVVLAPLYGATLVYAWHSLFEKPAAGGSGVVGRVGNAIFAPGALAPIGLAARRLTTPTKSAAI